MHSIHIFIKSGYGLSVTEHKKFGTIRIVNDTEDLTLFFDDVQQIKILQKALNSAIKKKKVVE